MNKFKKGDRVVYLDLFDHDDESSNYMWEWSLYEGCLEGEKGTVVGLDGSGWPCVRLDQFTAKQVVHPDNLQLIEKEGG